MNHQRLGRFVAVPALAGLVLAGCGTIEKDKRAALLQTATAGYEAALRWGHLDAAYGYLQPDLRPSQMEGTGLPPVLNDLRLTGYEVVQPPVIQGEGEAVQVATIDYLYEDRQVVKTITDRQVWRYDPKGRHWRLSSGLPKFQ